MDAYIKKKSPLKMIYHHYLRSIIDAQCELQSLNIVTLDPHVVAYYTFTLKNNSA